MPKPSIEWRRLDSSQDSVVGSELRFSSIAPQDGGQYECRARNGVEKDLTQVIKIRVLGKYEDLVGGVHKHKSVIGSDIKDWL